MKNFTTNTKSAEVNCYSTGIKPTISDDMKKAIYKAGMKNESLEDLTLYFEALVEVINEKKAVANGN